MTWYSVKLQQEDEVLLKAHGWGGRRNSGGVTSRTWLESVPDWMQAFQELDALLKKEDLQNWKSTSTKPSMVKWNFMNVLSSRREGVVREGVVEKDVVIVLEEISMPSSSSASEGGSSTDFEESGEEDEAETAESEGGEEEEEREGESSGQERAVGLENRKSSGAGGVGEEAAAKLRYREEEEGSNRRRRIGVRGGPVEGEREEGGEQTLTQYDLIMQKLNIHDRNDPTPSLPSSLALVIILIFRKFKNDIFFTN